MATYSIDYDLCSDKGLQHLFDYLLPHIATNSTITYGEIARRLQKDLGIAKIFSTHPGSVIGSLMYRILEIEPNAPLLNLLVVNLKDVPGKGANGFIRDRFRLPGKPTAPIPNRGKYIEKEASRVFTYNHWPRIYRRLFKTSPPKIAPISLVQGTERDGMPPATSRGGHGITGEGPEHAALKAYVLANPSCVGAPRNPDTGDDEFGLLSGDEIDVVFETKTSAYLVEVKSVRSNNQDLIRGVYQCVKYGAVFRAQRSGITPNIKVHSILAVEKGIPTDIRALAKLNNVRVKVVKRSVTRLAR
ncbi:MAG TPA: hypothetical protein VGG10_22670 [Rhizomicrobium sp.]|jgi:hypothetical protein